jgi:putative nucleotidyltransferase with HDIG domain
LREKDFSLIQKIGNLLKACKPLMGPIQRDHVTNHSREVCRVAIRIARLLKMSDPAKRSLAAAALLHDLGKIALPEELVAKPTSLTPEEAALLAQHADFSAWMAFELSGDEHTADIIRHHHSRYDGKSARQTISGEQLPLGARILNAADTFVVMKSERPYRTPTSITATSAELTNQRNLQFDPRIVDVLLESTAARTSASD